MERECGRSDDDRVPALDMVAELQSSLAKLRRIDDSETGGRDLQRISESRQATAAMLHALLTLEERLSRTESLIQEVHGFLKNQRPTKEWYTVKELTEILGKAEFTVREWCRLGRVNASKRECGRGNSQEWIVSHEELTRLQNEGLLPE